MIRTITLENFMSHGKTVIELADGLTVLTGPNNCGKSALVSALQIIAANGRTTHVMRHGSKFCRITVETDDDQTVIWERKKSTVKYNINGEDVHRIGQGIPENLHEVLRLDRVSTESGASKNDYDIHFGEQKSPVFLLNESGSRAAAFFASSSDASKLVEMQHAHRGRTAKTRSEAKRLAAESEQNLIRLAAFAPIDEISKSVQAAEKLQNEIELGQQEQRRLTATIGRLSAVAKQLDRWQTELKTLAALDRSETTPEKMQSRQTECRRLREWLQSATRVAQTRDLERSRSTALAGLLPTPAQHPSATLAGLIARIAETNAKLAAAARITASCRPLAAPPQQQPAEACRQSLRKLRVAIDRQQSAQRLYAAVEALTAPPAIQPPQNISRLIQRLQVAETNRQKWKALQRTTQSLTAPPPIASTQSLQTHIDRLSQAQQHHALLARRCASFKHLRPIDPPMDTTGIKSALAKLKPLLTAAQLAGEKAAQAKVMVDNHDRLIREFVQANPKCETCGGNIDPESLMSTLPGAHAHADMQAHAAEQPPQRRESQT